MMKHLVISLLFSALALSGAELAKNWSINRTAVRPVSGGYRYVPARPGSGRAQLAFETEELAPGEALRAVYTLTPEKPVPPANDELYAAIVWDVNRQSEGFGVIFPLFNAGKPVQLVRKNPVHRHTIGGPAAFKWLKRQKIKTIPAAGGKVTVTLTLERLDASRYRFTAKINQTGVSGVFESKLDRFNAIYLGNRYGMTPLLVSQISVEKFRENAANRAKREAKIQKKNFEDDAIRKSFPRIRENLRKEYLSALPPSYTPEQTEKLLARIDPAGGFSGIDLHNLLQSNDFLRHIGTLARVYNHKQSGFYQAPRVKNAIFAMLENWVKTAPSPGTNWYTKMIARPQLIAPVAVLMYAELAGEKPQLLAELVKQLAAATPRISKDACANAANEAVMLLASAILSDNVELFRFTRDKIEKRVLIYAHFLPHGELNGVPEGIHPDGSFSYHNYNGGRMCNDGGYGRSAIGSISLLAAAFAGVDKSVAPQRFDIVIDYFLDGMMFKTYRQRIDPVFSGKTLYMWGSSKLPPAAVLSRYLNCNYRTAELQQAINYTASPAAKEYIEGNKMFYLTDSMMHRRKNFTFSVRMGSLRTAPTEGNGLWATNDGMMMTRTDGMEYDFTPDGGTGMEYANSSGIKPDCNPVYRAWDLMLVPGTTQEYFPPDCYQMPPEKVAAAVAEVNRIPYGGPRGKLWGQLNAAYRQGIPRRGRYKNHGDNEVSGGVSDGENGCCGMDYINTTRTVSGRKAWFFFDNLAVALGSNITARPTAVNPVVTTIDQTHHHGTVTVGFNGNKTEIMPEKFDRNSREVTFIHRGKAAYIPLEKMELQFSGKLLRRQMWHVMPAGALHYDPFKVDTRFVELPVFSAVIAHGKQVKNGSYSYLIAADCTAENAAAIAANVPVEILSNTAVLQAVRRKSDRCLQAIFYQDGSSGGLEVKIHSPAAFTVKETSGIPRIFAADMSCKSQQISGSYRSANGRVYRFEAVLPSGIDAGKSVELTLKETAQAAAAW